MPEQEPKVADVARAVRRLAEGIIRTLDDMAASAAEPPVTIDELAKRMHDDGYLANEGAEPFKDFLNRLLLSDLDAEERKGK